MYEHLRIMAGERKISQVLFACGDKQPEYALLAFSFGDNEITCVEKLETYTQAGALGVAERAAGLSTYHDKPITAIAIAAPMGQDSPTWACYATDHHMQVDLSYLAPFDHEGTTDFGRTPVVETHPVFNALAMVLTDCWSFLQDEGKCELHVPAEMELSQ
jgi:hypothetical protein